MPFAITKISLLSNVGEGDARAAARATAVYRVETNEPVGGENGVYADPYLVMTTAQAGTGWGNIVGEPLGKTNLPILGTLYNVQGGERQSLLAMSMRAERIIDEKRSFVIVTVEYETPDNNLSASYTPNPLLRPALIWMEHQNQTVAVDKAYLMTAGLPNNRSVGDYETICDSAGNPFETQLYASTFEGVIVQEFNTDTWTAAEQLISTFQNTISDGTTSFYSFGEHEAEFISAASSQPKEENGQKFWTVQVRVAVSRQKRYQRLSNVGLEYLDAQGVKQPFLHDDDPCQPVATPQPLALDGTKGTTEGRTEIEYLVPSPVDYAGLVIATP